MIKIFKVLVTNDSFTNTSIEICSLPDVKDIHRQALEQPEIYNTTIEVATITTDCLSESLDNDVVVVTNGFILDLANASYNDTKDELYCVSTGGGDKIIQRLGDNNWVIRSEVIKDLDLDWTIVE